MVHDPRTHTVRAGPAKRVPGQHRRTPERRLISRAHHRSLLDPARSPDNPDASPADIPHAPPAARHQRRHQPRARRHLAGPPATDTFGYGPPGPGILVETDTGKTPVLHPPRHTPGQQAPHRPDDSPLKSEAPTKSQIARLNSADQPLPTVRAAPCAQTTLTGGMRAGLHWSLRVLTSSHSTLAAAIAS